MLQELRLGVRSIRSWRYGAVVAAATLAIGIGTATTMYGFLRVALDIAPQIDDLPAMGRIFASSRTLGIERSQLSAKNVELLAGASSFESVGSYASNDSDLTVGAETATISTSQVSPGFFSVMRARAASGRLLSPADFRDNAPVVVVSDHVWRTYFAGRTVGEAVATIDETPRTIVGVLPPEFGFPFIGIGADMWAPAMPGPDGGQRRVSVIARLKPNRTWTAAAAELDALARPQNPNGLWTWSAIPVQQDLQKRMGGGLAMMFGPALVVLLIGCTNVACMLLARGVDREVELSVRAALGATRGRIVRQFLVENLLLAAVGGAFGCGLAFGFLKLVSAQMAQFRPDVAARIAGDAALLPVAFGFSLAACLLFGTLPAVRLSRRDIAAFLKGGSSTASARFVGYGARDLVVFLELGLAVALVVTGALFVRFVVELQRITPMFPANQVVAMEVPARDADAVADRLKALPGVAGVTAASGLPAARFAPSPAQVRTDNGRSARAAVIGADASFFQTIGLPMLRGRTFDASEANPHAAVAVVSETAAAVLWPGEEPIGARLTMTGRTATTVVTVIGVCRDALDMGALLKSGLVRPDIYRPLDRTAADGILLLTRAAGDARLLVKPIGAAARIAPTSPRAHARLLGQDNAFVAGDSVFVIGLIGGFGVIALILAGSGIFGVISQSVAQRTTEFGVRMAMGASARQVLRMVLLREARLILAAVATGTIGTLLVTRSAFGELITIAGTDPRLWMVVIVLCGGTAAAAVLFATCRITRLDPWAVLRRS